MNPFHWLKVFRNRKARRDQGRLRRLRLEPLEDRRLLAIDFGDAPFPYPTLLAENGARHTTGGVLMLGATVDSEADGTHSAGADADGADEDGVTAAGPLVVGQTTNITINVQGGSGFVNAWVDLNRDGDFDDTLLGEQFLTNYPVTAGNNVIPFSIPANLTPGQIVSRYRLTSASVASPSPTGLLPDGEVEDYLGTILEAPSLVVTTASDVVNNTDGLTSLREAIAFANSNADASVITFGNGSAIGGGTNFTDAAADTILLSGGQMTLTQPATITGSGADRLTIDANDASRIFEVASGRTVAISGMELTNGRSDGGGAILNNGTLTVTACWIHGNQATRPGVSGYGGGILSFGSLTVHSSTVSGNSADNFGGGINVGGGGLDLTSHVYFLTLINSTISGNVSSLNTGGVNVSNGTLILTNSTISGNSSADGAKDLRLFVTNVTAKNSAARFLNTGTNSTLTDAGGNLLGVDPQLAALGNYGGLMPTMIPLPGSPAIDGGDDSVLSGPGALTTDQRGFARSFGTRVDTGAVESRGYTHAIVAGDNQSATVNTAFANALRVSVSETGGSPIPGVQINFTAGTSPGGATATFPATATTNASGEASVTATVNGIAGNYTVTAARTGLTSVDFNLTNNAIVETPSLVVTTATDVVNNTDGLTSLREAIAFANSNADASVITFGDGSTISGGTNFTDATADTILLSGGQMAITATTTITGSGANRLTIDAQDLSRIFDISGTNVDVTLDGLTLQNGQTTGGAGVGEGGAVRSTADAASDLVIRNSAFSDNSATAEGGAVYASAGDVVILASTFTGNTTVVRGGAVTTTAGDLNITASTFSGNSSTGNNNAGGGAVYVHLGRLAITNSTLSNNSAANLGGAILCGFGPDVVIVHSTIILNQAAVAGGGMYFFRNSNPAELTIHNSIVAGNTPRDIDRETSQNSPPILFHSLIGNNQLNSFQSLTATDHANRIADANGNFIGGGAFGLINVATVLNTTLADNGGATFTHALIPGGLAHNTGNNALAETLGGDGLPGTNDANEIALTNDQRGAPFVRSFGPAVDMGAFESTVQLDFGDAPNGYPVTLAENGARHIATGPTLGATRDSEADGTHSASADADGADEDGITAAGPLVVGQTTNITINVQGGSGFVNAWVDLNRDGDFDDLLLGEQFRTNYPVTAGNNVIPFSIPANFTPGQIVSRYRLTSASVASPSPTGLLPDGEIEDYIGTIVAAAVPVATLQIVNSTLVENGGVATVRATLDVTSSQNVTVNLGFSGTATNNTDYSASSAAIVILAGQTSGAITLTSISDSLSENVESIVVDVTTVTNATENGVQQVTANIGDTLAAVVAANTPGNVVDLNRYAVSGSTLTINGTNGDDSIGLARIDANSFYTFCNNELLVFSTATINQVVVNGNSGRDTFSTLGAASVVENATLGAKSLTFTSTGLSLQSDAEVNIANGQSGDTVALNDSTGDDLLYMLPSYSYMWSPAVNDYLSWPIGFGTVTSQAGSGTDTLLMYGEAGAQTFEMNATQSSVISGGVTLTANNFEQQYSYGDATDVANLHGSAGDDTFYRIDAYSILVAGSGFQAPIGFPQVNVTSGGGSDSAILYDTAGNDTFTGSPSQATFVTPADTTQVNNFRYVYAFASTGNDVANLSGSTSDDFFYGTRDSSSLFGSSPAYYLQALAFDEVHANLATGSGGNDQAFLDDGPGGDTLTAQSNFAELIYAAGNKVRVTAFDTVYARGTGGGVNQRTVTNPLLYSLIFSGSWA